ncbi:hypothetical protein [Janthinobacterium sp. PC23-8]|uniref:hypothetical protein n=1 Tax=Janthinobacterium sp. PC23-8 TaxID=2012679 RepID=UPI0011403609|nr:hypothetical protein [Janthinobacterium sp. PC23-8]
MKNMNWDKFYSDIEFKELALLAPEFHSRGNPTTYSRDKNVIYLSSLDIDVEVTNESVLRTLLKSVKESYVSSINQGRLNIKRAYLAQVDFLELCKILYTLTGDEEFADPDFALNE